jgi:cellulase
MPKNNSPISNVNSLDMRCNVGGAQGVPGLCEINAGDTLTVEMHQQPGDRNCKHEAIGGRHFGPVMVYMCAVADAKTSTGDCSWVKVAEDSYTGTEASWGTVSWIQFFQELQARC